MNGSRHFKVFEPYNHKFKYPHFKMLLYYLQRHNVKFRGHEISWFDEIGHVCGHLNLWTSNYKQYN